MKSRMKGDFHVRFRGHAGVKFPSMTRLDAIGKSAVGKGRKNTKKQPREVGKDDLK
jgi:hypothetical protein